MNLPTKIRNWRKLLPILTFLCLAALLILTSCITVNPPANTQPTKQPQTQEPKPTPSPTQEVPLPRIESFVADPSYNPGGSRLSGLSDAKIVVDTAWQRLSDQPYYYTIPALTDRYKPYDTTQLQKVLDELKKTPWASLYKANYFDCTEMSTLLQRELAIRGFESWIVIGKDPNVRSGHAWLVIFLRSPSIRLVPVEATALLIPQLGQTYRFSSGVVQTYEDYTRQGWVLQDIYQAISWWSTGEFDWWNRTDILQKLGLPTLDTNTTPVNNSPNMPSNPVPANRATDISVLSFSWSGGDPDKDDRVTYDVYFGTTPSPPLVSSHQSETKYTPPLQPLPIGTKCYWKIVATDNHELSTEGSVWEFTTIEKAPPPSLTVGQPSGPSTGKVNEVLTYTTVARSNIAGNLEYQFGWGDGSYSNWSSSSSASHSWVNSGAYTIKAQVRQSGLVSAWSGGIPVTITTTTLIPQHIETPMQGVSILQISYMNYTKYLQAGDVIDGVVQLTGPSHSVDNTYQWQFQILGPGGESIKVLTGDFRTTSSLQFHVPVSYAGTYRIRVTHQSISTKTLSIDLTPPGWGYANLG